MIGRKFLSALSRGQYTLTELKASNGTATPLSDATGGGFILGVEISAETGRAVLGRGHLAVLRLP